MQDNLHAVPATDTVSGPGLTEDGAELYYHRISSDGGHRILVAGWAAPVPLELNGGVAGEEFSRGDWGPDGGLVIEYKDGTDFDIVFVPRL